MHRQSFVLVGIIAVIGLLAILMTLQGAPESLKDQVFNTPTPTFTPTQTVEPEVEPAALPGFDPGPDTRTNCTYPIEIWRSHPAAWGLESIRIGSMVYTKDEMLRAMSVTPSQIIDELLQQLFIVIINQRFGADATIVLEVIIQATAWLNAHTETNQLSEEDAQLAKKFVNTLKMFNAGEIGPGSCDFPIAERPMTPTATLPPADVSNPPQGSTPAAQTPTASPTSTPVTFIMATATARPAIAPSATPTKPPSDNPTQPPPPTPEPSPTSPPPPTLPSLPTPAPTQEPDPPTPTQAPPP